MSELNFEGLPELPLRVRTGVLYKEVNLMDGMKNPITGEYITSKKAIYIIEHIIDPHSFDMVVAYQPKAKSNPPVKDYAEKVYKSSYRETTPLGKLAVTSGRKQERKRVEEAPPLFVTPVIEGIDTFNNTFGLGFPEREPDKFLANGERKEGNSTGVFITLDSVEWGQTHVPTREVVANYTAMRDVWFHISNGREI